MKANEFVKKYGLAEAKNILHGMDDASEFTAHMPGDTWDKPTLIDAVGLRLLVESYELVESYGGLDQAKSKLDYFYWMPMGGNNHVLLSKAIADVESCHVD